MKKFHFCQKYEKNHFTPFFHFETSPQGGNLIAFNFKLKLHDNLNYHNAAFD